MSGNQAAFLLEPRGRFEVRDAPIEQPGFGEVLVKVGVHRFYPGTSKINDHDRSMPEPFSQQMKRWQNFR